MIRRKIKVKLRGKRSDHFRLVMYENYKNCLTTAAAAAAAATKVRFKKSHSYVGVI